MGKKILCVVIVILLVFAISSILYYKTFISDNENAVIHSEPVPNQDIEVLDTKSDKDIVEISLDSITGITPEEAEKLCQSVLGEKDEETGFTFSFGTSGAVEANGKQYYVIRASWLVNNSHMSYIGDFYVSADGKEIYSGTTFQGEYIMENIIWSEDNKTTPLS